jgi:hypothetical protein
MVKRPVIQRYLSPDIWEKAESDLTLKRLVRLINSFWGEYSLQLRENYFNIYYQGNSLAKVTPDKKGAYTATIHEDFLKSDKLLLKLKQYSFINEISPYVTFRIHPGRLYHFFQYNHLKGLSSNIRKRGYGEEITFEQALITDNPPTEKFIIIDRQVADHSSKAQIDLLALRRDSAHKPFHFVVIEVKLGRSSELQEKVGKQVNSYVDRIRKYMQDYVNCYKENYRQKKELGLFDRCLPDEIEIDTNEKTVEGLIVVGGSSGLADKKALPKLRQKIMENQWDVKVQRMRNEIEIDNKSCCDEL